MRVRAGSEGRRRWRHAVRTRRVRAPHAAGSDFAREWNGRCSSDRPYAREPTELRNQAVVILHALEPRLFLRESAGRDTKLGGEQRLAAKPEIGGLQALEAAKEKHSGHGKNARQRDLCSNEPFARARGAHSAGQRAAAQRIECARIPRAKRWNQADDEPHNDRRESYERDGGAAEPDLVEPRYVVRRERKS